MTEGELMVDPMAVIASLDIEQMQAQQMQMQRQIDALDMLIRAAIVHRDGKPAKGRPGKEKKFAASPTTVATPRPTPNGSAFADGGRSLKLRVIDFLRERKSARINVIADELAVDAGELRILLQTDEAFESRGVGFYALA